jgi:hypothetical protein
VPQRVLPHVLCDSANHLHDGKALVSFDHVLEAKYVVAGRDQEANRRGTKIFVLGDQELDRSDARGIRAFAKELCCGLFASHRPDPVIDITQKQLVADAPVALIVFEARDAPPGAVAVIVEEVL